MKWGKRGGRYGKGGGDSVERGGERGDELMKEPKSSSGEIERGQARCTMWYL